MSKVNGRVYIYKELFEGLIMLMSNIENSRALCIHVHVTSRNLCKHAETDDWPGASLLSMKEEVLSCRKKSRLRAWEKDARRSRAEVIGKKAGQMFIELNDTNLFTSA